MLDVSGSMEGNLPLLREGSKSSSGGCAPTTAFASGHSDMTSTISPTFTRDPRELRGALPRAIAPDAPTPLWRAMDQAMSVFKSRARTMAARSSWC